MIVIVFNDVTTPEAPDRKGSFSMRGWFTNTTAGPSFSRHNPVCHMTNFIIRRESGFFWDNKDYSSMMGIIPPLYVLESVPNEMRIQTSIISGWAVNARSEPTFDDGEQERFVIVQQCQSTILN
jgi:hypothetical protein